MKRLVLLACICASPALAAWKVAPPSDERQPLPKSIPQDAKDIKPGDPWPDDQKFHWLFGDIEIPERIGDEPVRGRPIALQFNCGDGGEVHVEGTLQSRYDNDHPALVLLAEKAVPGRNVRVAALVYGKVQGGDRFGEANLVLVEPKRATQRLGLRVSADKPEGEVPHGLAGLSQGGGLSDYDDATAAKLKEGGFHWFRMDNILTNALKKDAQGQYTYDWTDLDRRADFIAGKMGAEPIFAASYMPQVLDAVENHERQSAPKDYAIWEELCYQAAKRCIQRGVRVPYWEVWNEVNTGWLKPGPQDTGAEPFKKIYERALGQPPKDAEVVRRFEAYCRLYEATAKGVRRADARAMIGGPALASGPMEQSDCGHCANGRGFALGLMYWCADQRLPLDFLSWHEYFQESSVIARQADTFRDYLRKVPSLAGSNPQLMITEWNQAWWADRPHDHEIGAAWCADGLVRAIIPHRIDKPCAFYVKQGDTNFRGDFSILMKDNVPKATYNVLRMFNSLRGRWVPLEGGDGEVAGVAALDIDGGRLAVALVNFQYRYGLRRQVTLAIDKLPASLASARWREWIVDATHANAWNNMADAELKVVASGPVGGRALKLQRTLSANSVTLIEIVDNPREFSAPLNAAR